MSVEIENILFSRFVKQAIPFELISIRELYERCKKSAYDLSNPHRIKFHALILITEGKSYHTIDFKEYPIFPGVVLPLTKEQVHSFNKALTVKGYVISFEESFITRNISEKNLFHFLQLFHTPSIFIGEENLPTLQPHFALLTQIHQAEDKHLKSELINALLLALLLHIKRLSITQHEIIETRRFKDFIRFKQLITHHYQELHDANAYANRMGVSYKYLNEVCKEITKQTAKSFIDSWLLLEIKRNLSEKKYTSQEIAYRMGFNEPSNFIRFFKKFTGMTPTQFLKEKL